MPDQLWVYILASRSRRLYIGVTRDMVRRWHQHAAAEHDAFTAKYRINRLVYVEVTGRIGDAVAREKQLKGWRRSKKIALIEATNPAWQDLAEAWGWRQADPSTPR
jgi:putative endonuclease